MTKPSDPQSLMLRIDDACESFESDWQSGRAPSLREVIDRLDASTEEIPAFFHEMLLLDLELRAEAGEEVTSEHYVEEFPQFRELIETSFREFNPKSPTARTPSHPSADFETSLQYRLVEPIAEGGLGRIYRVLDQTFGRELAMKEIKQGLDNSNTRARFDREARLTAKLDHPGITPVFGIGSHPDGRPLYVMRLIRGESLREVIRQYHGEGTGPGGMTLGLRNILSKFVSVCEVIAYVHSQGIVHRDLKPSNVMLGPFGEVLVVDWGLAKEISAKNIGNDQSSADPDGSTADWTAVPRDSFQTVPGRAVGTPQFMSPEQALAKIDEIGPLSDIYSLGATLYDLLTGRPPFSESNDAETVLRRVVCGDFVSPRKVRPGLPRSLEAVCLKAMALNPSDRYPTAEALVNDLRLWLADEPVSARPEPFLERTRRWLTKHRLGVAGLTGAFLIAFSLGVPLFVRAQFAAARRRDDAKAAATRILSAKDHLLAGLINGLDPKNTLIFNELESRFKESGLDDDDKLKAALALGPGRVEIREYLEKSLLDTRLSLLPLICETLQQNHSATLLDRLRTTLGDEKQPEKARFQAATALVRLAPPRSNEERDFWKQYAALIVAGLVEVIRVDPSLFRILLDSFQPLKHELFPALAAKYREVPDRAQDGAGARLAITGGILDGYQWNAQELVELLKDTPVGSRFTKELDKLLALGEAAVATLRSELDRPASTTKIADPDDEIAAEAQFDSEAIRKSRLAIALFVAGKREVVWPILGSRKDPALREEIIRRLPRMSPEVRAAILERLPVESDAAVRASLILSLPTLAAETDRKEIPRATRDWLLEQYKLDPDPGVHGAIDWILRNELNEAKRLAEIDASLRRDNPAPTLGWFIDRSGQTLSIIKPDDPVTLGSPDDEPGRTTAESIRRVQIQRVFAIGAREVSLASYTSYVKAMPETARPVPVIDVPAVLHNEEAPVIAVTWFDVAGYCNWLSEINGIPQSQWCYADVGKDRARLVPDALKKTGYRLPTEAEWETACRAGTRASRPFGNGWQRASEFGWFPENADGRLRTSGEKRPNGYGLFDMLGNASEWTLSPYAVSPTNPAAPIHLDSLDFVAQPIEPSRVIRGGSILIPPRPRSAQRDHSLPTNQMIDLGFRVCRTLL